MDDAILMAEVMVAEDMYFYCLVFLFVFVFNLYFYVMAQVMAAGEGQLEGLVDRLKQQGVHATHYIMVRLELRSMLNFLV